MCCLSISQQNLESTTQRTPRGVINPTYLQKVILPSTGPGVIVDVLDNVQFCVLLLSTSCNNNIVTRIMSSGPPIKRLKQTVLNFASKSAHDASPCAWSFIASRLVTWFQ